MELIKAARGPASRLLASSPSTLIGGGKKVKKTIPTMLTAVRTIKTNVLVSESILSLPWNAMYTKVFPRNILKESK